MLFERLWRSNFMIKLRHWEYWPFGILQFPVLFYYLWLSLKARSFFFFSASNPGIEMGGMLGESKYKILEKIPSPYVAKTIYIHHGSSLQSLLTAMEIASLTFPVIFKPDLGERGYRVKRIQNAEEAKKYLETFHADFLVQELVDLPFEFGVFYKRLPSESNGMVFSIVGKKMLSVVGDGKHDLETLILKYDRAKLQWPVMQKQHAGNLKKVLANGEVYLLNSIGNHCLGTTFLDNNHLITDALIKNFDMLSKQIDGFYYGRFDLRCASLQDLELGNVKVLELNGCGAEPAHIYQPGFSFWKAVRVMFAHWNAIFKIAEENRQRGYSYLTYQEVKKYYQLFKSAIRA